jgi:mono/diheme cytochrome c family protein
MRATKSVLGFLLAGSLGFAGLSASAVTPAELQQNFETAARASAPGFTGFSAQRGRQFFSATHGNDWSCASCHTQDPVAPGRHAKTGKNIAPLSPVTNPQRFTDAAKAEKWFSRNCNDVLGRPCTAQEKGDVLAYLLSLGK